MSTYQKLRKREDAHLSTQSDVCVTTYTGQAISVQGVLHVTVTFRDQKKDLDLLVVKGSGPSLLGCDWLKQLVLDWHSLNHASSTLVSGPDSKQSWMDMLPYSRTNWDTLKELQPISSLALMPHPSSSACPILTEGQN